MPFRWFLSKMPCKRGGAKASCRAVRTSGKKTGTWIGQTSPVLSYFCISSHVLVCKNANLHFYLLSFFVCCFPKISWWPINFPPNPLTSHMHVLVILGHTLQSQFPLQSISACGASPTLYMAPWFDCFVKNDAIYGNFFGWSLFSLSYFIVHFMM